MPAQSIAQKFAALEELDRRVKGEEPQKFKGISDEDLREIADTPSEDLPEKVNL